MKFSLLNRIYLLAVATGTLLSAYAGEGPYLATGIKIGEVSQTKAIIWVRLSKNPKRVGNNAPMPVIRYYDEDSGELEGLPSLTLSLNGDPVDPEVLDNFAYEVRERYQEQRVKFA